VFAKSQLFHKASNTQKIMENTCVLIAESMESRVRQAFDVADSDFLGKK
jgi:hypothetical protein